VKKDLLRERHRELVRVRESRSAGDR
jgi:hypothetical protein